MTKLAEGLSGVGVIASDSEAILTRAYVWIASPKEMQSISRGLR